MKRAALTLIATVCLLGAGACSNGSGAGSGGDASSTSAGGGRATTEEELPMFMADFSRVCSTQVGFPGAKAYEAVPGAVHPIVFFEENEHSDFIQSGVTLPAGWTVTEDANYEDNTELAGIELVGCASIVETTPNGTQCEFDDDGQSISLELVNVTYEVAVYEATTGKVVGTPTTVKAESTECPFVVAYDDGDTTYNLSLDVDDVINALKPAVAP
jgi:hypothetical protein